MDLFSRIRAQIDSVAMPLYAVTLSAVYRADTPLLLILHWHGFRRETALRIAGVDFPKRPVAGSAMQINEGWQTLEAVDEAMLEAAWCLGAWDMQRHERRGCATVGASDREAHECRQAFGDYRQYDSSSSLVDEAPDRGALMDMASRAGYVKWQFRPVRGGLWKVLADDDATLDSDGGRAPPCPVLPRPATATGRRRGESVSMTYRLGKGNNGIRLA